MNEKLNQIEIPENLEKQFTILTKRIVLRGYCNNCRR
jgi:hypothetical protein